MSLMNRLFGDWRNRSWGVRDVRAEGLDGVSFQDLTAALEPDLYDAGTGSGLLVLINPARMAARSAITVLALGDTQADVFRQLHRDLPDRFAELAGAPHH
jgi:hypothetical protein